MDIGAFGKGKGKRSKGKHGKGKGKGKQGQQGQHGQDKDKSKDKNKDSVECWNCGKRGHYSKDCWSKKNTNKGGSKGKHKPKNAGKTAWPQSIKYGTTIPGDGDLTSRTAIGELVKGGKRVHVAGCDDWGSNLRVRGVQAPVCKPLLENTRRWVESLCCMVTKVTCSTKVRMLQRKWMLGSRRS